MTTRRPRFSSIVRCKIGAGTILHDHVNLYACRVGKYCKVDSFVYIEEGVHIGDRSRIRPFVFIPTGVRIGADVFIGPSVTFTNDKYPKIGRAFTLEHTIVEDGVSIGAGSVVLPGVKIGSGALIGAGSVVTKDVPPNTKYIAGRLYPYPSPLKRKRTVGKSISG